MEGLCVGLIHTEYEDEKWVPLSLSIVKYNSDSTAKIHSPEWLTFFHMRITHSFLHFAPLSLKHF